MAIIVPFDKYQSAKNTLKDNSHEIDVERRMHRDAMRKYNGLSPVEDPVALFVEGLLAAREDDIQ